MGEAAGVAAVLAVDDGAEFRDVDIDALQTQLVKQGALVDRPAEVSLLDHDERDGPEFAGSIHHRRSID